MGQESSSPIDESIAPQTLTSRTVEGAADYIKSGKVKRVVVMTGAGISTSAGIPDFRSPDTGLYANLARLDLPYAEAVFDISYFRKNPAPFYTLAQELYPGKFRPTISHCFVRLLHDRGLLLKLFTQNIDCLEREAGVPDEAIIEAHGSFAKQRCIDCKTPFPDDEMHEFIIRGDVPHCRAAECDGLVKPDIVFFGETLPEKFLHNRQLPRAADLAIVMGTSLSVQPFASLPGFCGEGVPRILINKEMVGGLGSRSDDVLMLGDCDEQVRRLAEALGWLDELEKLWDGTGAKTAKEIVTSKEPKTKDEELEDEINKLTGEIDQTLKLSSRHTTKVQRHLEGQSREKDELGKQVGSLANRDGGTEIVSPTTPMATSQNRDLRHAFPHVDKSSL